MGRVSSAGWSGNNQLDQSGTRKYGQEHQETDDRLWDAASESQREPLIPPKGLWRSWTPVLRSVFV